MNKLLSILSAAGLLLATSCSDKDNDIPEWPWDKPDDTEDVDPETPSKPRIVWIDAAGNFQQFANSRENIKADLQKVKDAGFTEIVVDVRPTNGDVLFNSSTGDPVTRMDCWTSAGYVWIDRTATWDYLQTFIDYGHELGLKVNASINTFVGGYQCPYGLGQEGMLFRDESRKSWASVLNTAEGRVSVLDMTDSYGSRFLNPANPEVRAYILDILGDLAKYDIDGIVLDRCRYDDNELLSDFSDESRTAFESFIGESVADFPADVMTPGTDSRPDTSTRWGRRWMSFRAKTIHDFVVEARERVKSVNPDIKFGVYVGAWYSTYYTSGVNWASPKFNPATLSGYSSWADSDYMTYGYADHLDMIFIGAYASADRIYGSGEWSMQGFCVQAGTLLKGDVKYYGGPDIGNSGGWVDGGQQSRIPDAVNACYSNSDGFFAFDLCHIRSFSYWDAFKRAFENLSK